MHSVLCNTYTVQCSLPVSNDQITIRQVNNTEMGSILHFQCKQGLSPEDYVDALCSNDGQWMPNPDKHHCYPLVATTPVLGEFAVCNYSYNFSVKLYLKNRIQLYLYSYTIVFAI